LGVEGRFGGLNQGFAGAGFGGFPGAYGGAGFGGFNQGFAGAGFAGAGFGGFPGAGAYGGAGFGGFPGAYGGYGGCAAWLAGRVARRRGTRCGVVGAGRALPQCGAGRPV
jgi:hypothetical protein